MNVSLSADTILWLVLTIAFIIAEGATTAFVSIWFAVGAGAAMLVSVFTDSWLLQAFVFLAVSALCWLSAPMRFGREKAAVCRQTLKPISEKLPPCSLRWSRVKLAAFAWRVWIGMPYQILV